MTIPAHNHSSSTTGGTLSYDVLKNRPAIPGVHGHTGTASGGTISRLSGDGSIIIETTSPNVSATNAVSLIAKGPAQRNIIRLRAGPLDPSLIDNAFNSTNLILTQPRLDFTCGTAEFELLRDASFSLRASPDSEIRVTKTTTEIRNNSIIIGDNLTTNIRFNTDSNNQSDFIFNGVSLSSLLSNAGDTNTDTIREYGYRTDSHNLQVRSRVRNVVAGTNGGWTSWANVFTVTDDMILDLADTTRDSNDRGKALGTSKTNQNALALLTIVEDFSDLGDKVHDHADNDGGGKVSYDDLDDKPSIPTDIDDLGDIVHTHDTNDEGGKISYDDLDDKPNIPDDTDTIILYGFRVDDGTMQVRSRTRNVVAGTNGSWSNWGDIGAVSDVVADTNTTYTISISGKDITLTGSDGTVDTERLGFLTAAEIDARIDAKIATHAGNSSAHHVKTPATDLSAYRTATQILALIAAHASRANAHHTPPASVDLSNYRTASQIAGLIEAHRGVPTAHQTITPYTLEQHKHNTNTSGGKISYNDLNDLPTATDTHVHSLKVGDAGDVQLLVGADKDNLTLDSTIKLLHDNLAAVNRTQHQH